MADDLQGGGPALFRLVRFWSRRGPLRVSAELTGEERRLQDIQVLEAVAATPGDEASVADVAHQLGIDRSGASRFVSDAVAHGYLTRGAATDDARRAVLTVTPDGHELLAGARAWQERVFGELTAGWPAEDAADLARHLRRLAAELPTGR
ncbi:MarR family winged helix-turn-helix transcriptional regulator [Pseudonocardia humida]|uniref:Winged helix-turn-helix transcriptional regulator n=1 Tax=Pseudonocardia humida TaxID=2800819 RepID=A0ABT1A9X9_9PSEU|nr:MarR family winged helix-turn-helix transcriptional regulator [Pseudonocardia humida]MCO1659464.1 winged helix-turn-helix transcriptional regulator [Pseudonocardia humida]